MVLHRLSVELTKQGHQTLLWPLHRACIGFHPLSRQWWHRWTYAATRLYRPWYGTRPGAQLNVACMEDLDDAIVIYPEIVVGNPLRAKRYVRWILYRSDLAITRSGFRRGDLCFCYQDAFNVGLSNMTYGGVLHVTDLLLDIYKRTNAEPRSGISYMIRKGNTRTDLPSFRGKDVLDHMSHTEIAHAFNACERCYFYDAYTFYSTYASVCGCIPVIVPLPGMSRNEWEPNGGRKPGLAYGEEDISYAVESRPLLLANLQHIEAVTAEHVARFATVTSQHFA